MHGVNRTMKLLLYSMSVILAGASSVASFVVPPTLHTTRVLHRDASHPLNIKTDLLSEKSPFLMARRRVSTSLSAGLAESLLAGRSVLHSDPTFVLSATLLLSTFGILLERRTLVGKALSVRVVNALAL